MPLSENTFVKFRKSLEAVTRDVFYVKYPDYEVDMYAPVRSGLDGGQDPEIVQTISTNIIDRRISGSFVDQGAGYVAPDLVGVTTDSKSRDVFTFQVGAYFDQVAIAAAAAGDIDLVTEKMNTAQMSCQAAVYNSVIEGKLTMKGQPDQVIDQWQSLIKNSAITSTTVPNDGTGSSTKFADKDSDKIIRDVTAGVSKIIQDTNEQYEPNTILVPPSVYKLFKTKPRASGSDMTILQWLMATLEQSNGEPITIRGMRELATAGGSNTGRMVIYRNDPELVTIWVPLPPRSFTPFTIGGFGDYEVGLENTYGRVPASCFQDYGLLRRRELDNSN